jgi:hypothetical protein
VDPEQASADAERSSRDPGPIPPPQDATGPGPSPETILDVDGRLLVLERTSREYRLHLVKFEDALITQIYTVGVLELTFAIFLATAVWSQYRRVTKEVRD